MAVRDICYAADVRHAAAPPTRPDLGRGRLNWNDTALTDLPRATILHYTPTTNTAPLLAVPSPPFSAAVSRCGNISCRALPTTCYLTF